MKIQVGPIWIAAWLLVMPSSLWSQESDFQAFLQAALRNDANEALQIFHHQDAEELQNPRWTAQPDLFLLDSIQSSRVRLGEDAQRGILRAQKVLADRSDDPVFWTIESALTVLFFQSTQSDSLLPILSRTLRVGQHHCPSIVWQELSAVMLDSPPLHKADWGQWLEAYEVLAYVLIQMPVIEPGLQRLAESRYHSLTSHLEAYGQSCEAILEEETSRIRLGFVTPEEYKKLFLLTEIRSCPASAQKDTIRRRVARLAPTPFILMRVAESYLRDELFWEAQKYMLQASEAEVNASYRSAIELRLAGLYAIRRSFRSARLHARQSHELYPEWGRPWLFLADLIETSGPLCAANDQQRWALAYLAIEYCEKAANINPALEPEVTGRINALRKKVPDPMTLTFSGLRVGDRIPVSCWINETARVR